MWASLTAPWNYLMLLSSAACAEVVLCGHVNMLLCQHSSVFLARHPSVDMTDFNLEACRPILEGTILS